MIKYLAIFAFILMGLPACSEYAENEVREKFDMPINKSLSERNIEEAVIRKMPLGTSENDIYKDLEELGFGEDNLSSFYRADKNSEIVARIEYDPDEFGFVKKSYGIIFKLDANRHLKGVKVHEWFTGL